jgi:glutamate-5-semialdehyde dehydrogenase
MDNAESQQTIPELMDQMGVAARAAAAELARSTAAQRSNALRRAAVVMRNNVAKILSANQQDMTAAEARGLSGAMLDRLMLDPQRVEAMAASLESIDQLPDPVGRIMAEFDRPNGLKIQRVAVPIGVIGIIYESRPNVTADAAALCLKSGNAVILRGGSESFHSSTAIHQCMVSGLDAAGIDTAAVQMVPTTEREAVGYMLSSMSQNIDVVVPRGGKRLIERVHKEARVPVIGHLEGICHVYLHESADAKMAEEIVVNAKMRRTGICGSAETLLVDRSVAADLLPPVAAALERKGCEIRAEVDALGFLPNAIPATEEDWTTEYLDAIISVRVVDNIEQAMQHISQYGSGHTECIVAADDSAAERFFADVDSAILLHNASTQFADGGEFGMGAEIGIATGRIHARGPVGAEQLTSYKYVVRGNGQVRP